MQTDESLQGYKISSNQTLDLLTHRYFGAMELIEAKESQSRTKEAKTFQS